MQLLSEFGIAQVFHFAPLHYLPFIARNGRLCSKPALRKAGFAPSHFRSTSAHLDALRGFGDFVHLSTTSEPPILCAKLQGGFPHFAIAMKTLDLATTAYDLCRFNLAKTRYLRRDGKAGFEESDANGSYYCSLQIPVARSYEEKRRMLSSRRGDPMLEVLIEEELYLPLDVGIRVYSEADQVLAVSALGELAVKWPVLLDRPPVPYTRKPSYVEKVEGFMSKSLANAAWRGDGLEFDRV